MLNRIKRKKQHSGSTLLVVLIAISFISLIGAVAVFTAYTNLTLKKYDLYNKENFYTAESVVDEIYTGIGMNAMDNLSESYSYVLSHMTVTKNLGNQIVETEMDDTEANAKLQKRYIANVMKQFGGTDSIGEPYFKEESISGQGTRVFLADDDTNYGRIVCANTLTELNKYVKEGKNATVESISGVYVKYDTSVANGSGYSITIKDATINYKEGSQNLFSEVTVDFVIDYPAMSVVFNTDKLNRIKTFKDYVFIGQQAVKFQDANNNVSGGIYGGCSSNGAQGISDGIVFTDSSVNLSNSPYVSAGNIVIANSSSSSDVIFSNSDLWGNNIIVRSTVTGQPASRNNKLTIDANCSTHLSDDLQIEAAYSDVTVGGDYWGYGTGNFGDTHSQASALVLNGKNSKLNMTSLKNLLLAGKAYIVYGDNQLAATAESLGLKGNQRYYVVPDKYLKGTYTDSTGATAVLEEVIQPVNPSVRKGIVYSLKDPAAFSTDFFGYKYLDASNPFTQQNIPTNAPRSAYAYLNFKDNASANSYLRCLLDDTFFASEFPNPTQEQANSREELKTLTLSFLKSLDATSGVSFASGAKIYTTGLLLEYTGLGTTGGLESGGSNTPEATLDESVGGSVENNTNPLFASRMNLNFSNRYSILNHMLLSLRDVDDAGNFIIQEHNKVNVVYEDGVKYTIDDDCYTKTVWQNIIDEDVVKNNPLVIDNSATTGEYIWIGEGNVSVPANASYGVVVSTGSITLSSSFNGIAISKANINVTGSGNYSNTISGYADVADYIEQSNGGRMAQYFIPCQGMFSFGDYNDPNADNNKISKVKYTDLVTYSNWRKTVSE